MKSSTLTPAFLLLLLAGCGDGARTADVVQAATKGAVEASQLLAEQAAKLAELTPAEARAKLQGFLDDAAAKLQEIKDSETARRFAAELERVFDELVELARKLGEKLDLAGLKASVGELVERFKSDPRVVQTLESLKAKLDALTGPEK